MDMESENGNGRREPFFFEKPKILFNNLLEKAKRVNPEERICESDRSRQKYV